MKYFGNKSIYVLIVAIVFLIGFLLRFYKLGAIPHGLYTDETAIGYNAYSIAKTQRDEHGKYLPLYFESFSDYKLPVYIYLTAASESVFGENAFAVRLPSALFGFFTIVAVYFLVLALSQKRMLSLIASFLIAINPWHTFFSRVGYEVNVATALLVFGTLFFILAVKRKNNIFLFFLSIVSFILSLYTYNVTRVVSPLIFLGLVVLYREQILKLGKGTRALLLGVFFIGTLPFVLTLKSSSGFSSHQDILIIGTEAKANILQTKSYLTTLPGLAGKTLFNYWILVFWQYIRNLVSFFSTDFFFINGGDHPINSIGGMGMFYIFEFPTVLIGLYYGAKRKVTFLYPFYFWLATAYLIGSLVKVVPHATRSYVAIIPLSVLSSYGFYLVLKHVQNYKKKYLKKLVNASIVILISYSCLFYFISYFLRFPIEQAKAWRSEDEKLMAYLGQNQDSYTAIYLDKSADISYTSLLFYLLYPPSRFQKDAVYESDGLLLRPKKIGKYEYRTIDWENDIKRNGVLIVTNKNNQIPMGLQTVAVFSYPQRPVVVFYDNKIGQYPTTDIAYQLIVGKNRK